MADIPEEIMEKVKTIKGKRAMLAVELILSQGSATTEDLEDRGYKDAASAFRDVRDQGLPLKQTWAKNRSGQKIARYEFGDVASIRHDRLGSRQVLSKEFQGRVRALHDSKCAICHIKYEPRYLQMDHRVPFGIDEGSATVEVAQYQPLCGPCNRAKSWSCEHCENWLQRKDPTTCLTCYWASPEEYRHVALRPIRRLDLVWEGAEVADFQGLVDAAKDAEPLPEYVKTLLRRVLKGEDASE